MLTMCIPLITKKFLHIPLHAVHQNHYKNDMYFVCAICTSCVQHALHMRFLSAICAFYAQYALVHYRLGSKQYETTPHFHTDFDEKRTACKGMRINFFEIRHICALYAQDVAFVPLNLIFLLIFFEIRHGY